MQRLSYLDATMQRLSYLDANYHQILVHHVFMNKDLATVNSLNEILR
jgi:hypothetical protein